MAKKFQKILISAIVFAITFVNYGLPMQSIASEGKKLFKFSFFHKDEIALEAYFDEDLEKTEKVLNVNDVARLTVDVNPLIEGYFEEGTLELNLKNGNENNFIIKSVTTLEQEEEKADLFNSVVKVEEKEETEKEESPEIEKETEDVSKTEETTKEEVKETSKEEEEVTKNFGSSLFDSTKNLFLDSSLEKENKNEVASNTTSTVSTSNTVLNSTNTTSGDFSPPSSKSRFKRI